MRKQIQDDSQFKGIQFKHTVNHAMVRKRLIAAFILLAFSVLYFQPKAQMVQAEEPNGKTSVRTYSEPVNDANPIMNGRALKNDINGPDGSGKFGEKVVALPNGNIVVTDPHYSSPGGPKNIGAVYLYDGSKGNLISTLTGSTAEDLVGYGGITVLTNGNYVVSSSSWNNGAATRAGAVTFCNGKTGILGSVSELNSLVGSTVGDSVGSGVIPLPNGNYVVSSFGWNNGAATRAGAVTFGNGTTGISGMVSSANSLVGSTADDKVGSGGYKWVDLQYIGPPLITVLTNGNYIVSSPDWNNGGATDAGAVTFGSGKSGVSGVVSPANSLVGSTAYDRVGALLSEFTPQGPSRTIVLVTALSNGNYVVNSPLWDGTATNAGAVTFGNGTTGVSGVVSASNSLVGSSANDNIGGNVREFVWAAWFHFGLVTALSNGNYVVSSPYWDNGAIENAGAVTFGNGTTGVSGVVSEENSLVGSTAFDYVGLGQVKELTNSNYVVKSPLWDKGVIENAGAVTFGNGTTGISGEIKESNSLVGLTAGDKVGGTPFIGFFFNVGVAALSNGNYVVDSPEWHNGAISHAGAVTFANGMTGISGTVSSANSLVGSTQGDHVGLDQVIELANGNYVVSSPKWDNLAEAATDAGAVTFGNGTTGIAGAVSASNSLVGISAGDGVGEGGVTALTNGNYVVGSPFWDRGAIVDAGAVTFANGMTGISGTVSPANSLVGSTGGDEVGNKGVTALSNGNFVVYSELWDGAAVNVGAVTWGNGTKGIAGPVSASNSLVGSTADDRVGIVEALKSGEYFVISPGWNNGSIADAGAVTFSKGTAGIAGEVSASNSLVGMTAGDRVGDGGVTELSIGDYVVDSYRWDNGGIVDAGAITYFSGPAVNLVPISTGYRKNKPDSSNEEPDAGNLTVQLNNSVMGKTSGGGASLNFSFDAVNRQLVVGCPYDNIVTLFQIIPRTSTLFDYDGDGRSDIGVWRSGAGEWWYLRSSDNAARSLQFGETTDTVVPADFTGDGKTDLAYFRPSSGEWFVLRSEDNSFFSFAFGTKGDIPAPGDFDGDGKADAAVYRPSSGTWWILHSTDANVENIPFGIAEDRPTVADFDGDGMDDIGVYRPSNSQFWQLRSSAGAVSYQFGNPGDSAAVGDYTGDGKADVAVWRESSGEWIVLRSEDNSFFAIPWGMTGDVPAPGDYDGDGRIDAAVFRTGNSTWYVLGSQAGAVSVRFGAAGDTPLQSTRVVP